MFRRLVAYMQARETERMLIMFGERGRPDLNRATDAAAVVAGIEPLRIKAEAPRQAASNCDRPSVAKAA
ncbi:MAG: hypothetical protein INR70_01975 [Parafilimonas terrae]|jgi:hypothetical protein|nr:hypothetical protein [Parafilimonas terrae]